MERKLLGLAAMTNAGNTLRALALGVGVLTTAAACVADDTAPTVSQTSQKSTFDWGSDCSSGQGSFSDYIPYQQIHVVGDVPVGKRNVSITLDSPADVDVQLVDKKTGFEIIAWPSGLLNGAGFECAEYKGVEYCYSGYNGVNGNLGKETIEVRGDTNVELTMRAYGYEAGNADVSYAWQPVPTCNEKGSGSFSTNSSQGAVDTIGEIPVNKFNVLIELSSDRDLDIQLFDGQTALVKWPDGLLNGPDEQALDYNGMVITWSGYNGTFGQWGNEFIRIDGRVTANLTMKAYAYQSGSAEVVYEWGVGAGELCGSLNLAPCGPGLVCKNGENGNIAADKPGSCHNPMWCESNESATDDCSGVIHPAVPGQWACQEFSCKWQIGPLGESCSLADPTCPQGYTCQIGCPTAENCGINPPGICVMQ